MPSPPSQSKSTSILDFIYEHIDELLWQKAVQIYRAAEITASQDRSGLITAILKDPRAPRGAWNIRFKMQFEGRVIRWFECGCLEHRKTGGLCCHIVAVLIYISREKPDLFVHLDAQSPFATNKIITRKSSKSQKASSTAQPSDKGKGKEKKVGSTDHKKISNPMWELMSYGSIHRMKFNKKSGCIQIQFELKRTVKDQFELSVDESTLFLSQSQYQKWCEKYLKDLSIFPLPAYLGWKIADDPTQELWQAQKIVLIAIPTSSAYDHQRDMAHSHPLLHAEDSVCLWKASYKMTEDHTLFSLPWQQVVAFCGEQALYIPDLGYLHIAKNTRNAFWQRSAKSLFYRGKEIDRLIETEFSSLASHSPILIHPSWKKSSIVPATIDHIHISDYDGHFFHMDPYYRIDNTLEPLTMLLSVARDKNRQFIHHKNRWIKIPLMMIDLDFHLDNDKKVLKLDTLSCLRWQSLVPSLQTLWQGNKELLETLEEHMNFQPLDDRPLDLAHTQLSLRDYQLQGARWLWWLYQNHLHGLCADDMGLGKTHQTMALLSLVSQRDPSPGPDSHPSLRFLVVCPTTVVGHWMEKIRSFAPVLKPLRYHGTDRQLKPDYTTLITSYGVLLRDIERLAKYTWNVVVCDEAHIIKNPKTSTYWACKRLQARMRLCLSGTPIENRLEELKTLFDFLVPGYLGSPQFFKKYYGSQPEDTSNTSSVSEHTIQNNREKEERLKNLIAPLRIRRTKSQVLKDLPEKIEDIRHCELSPRQRELYQEAMDMQAQALLTDLRDDRKPIPFMHVFALLQKLKQICDHPALVTDVPWQQGSSNKFELLKELLSESLGSGHKVVVFSQYVKMIDIITAYLTAEGIKYVSLVGKSRHREKLVESFQNDPSISVFVGSLLAGGVGIDLTAASVVIHYDRWWNASKENQATDRVHRIGQKHSLLILKLVTMSTIEEKIDVMIQKKQKLFDTFLTKDGSNLKNFTREDLIHLVSS